MDWLHGLEEEHTGQSRQILSSSFKNLNRGWNCLSGDKGGILGVTGLAFLSNECRIAQQITLAINTLL